LGAAIINTHKSVLLFAPESNGGELLNTGHCWTPSRDVPFFENLWANVPAPMNFRDWVKIPTPGF